MSPQSFDLTDLGDAAEVPIVRPRTVRAPPAPAPQPEPGTGRPSSLSSEEWAKVLMERMRPVLLAEKGKSSAPTLVSYTEEGRRRHVLVEVPEPYLSEAFRIWQDADDPSGVAFLMAVNTVLGSWPRMYRTIAVLDLDGC